MAKITISDLTSAFASTTALNSKFQQLEDELNDKVLYRDNPVGESNAMSNDMDMANNGILNLDAPVNNNDAARLQDILDAASTSTSTAVLTSINDSGSYYTSDNVEGALDEIGLNRIQTVADKAAAVLLTPEAGKSINILSDDGKGGIWNAVTGAAAGTYTDNGGLYCGTVFIPTGGDGSTAWVRDHDGYVLPEMFGINADGSSDVSSDIEDLIEFADTYLRTPELIDAGGQVVVASNKKRLSLNLFNNEIDSSNLLLGSDAASSTKYSYLSVTDSIIDGSTGVDTGNNKANISSNADYTGYHDTVSINGGVGFSFQKQYTLPSADAVVRHGTMNGLISSEPELIGFEYYSTIGAVASSCTMDGDVSAPGIGFRIVGDLTNENIGTSLSACSSNGAGNALSVQANVRGACVSAFSAMNSINAFSMPDESGGTIDAVARFNSFGFTADTCQYGIFSYGNNFNTYDAIIVEPSVQAIREETNALGSLKSNRYDVSVFAGKAGGEIKSSNSIIRVLEADIEDTGLFVSGSHNHITFVADEINSGNTSKISFNLSGSYNIVDVITTNNPTAFDDILVSGNKNIIRTICDGKLNITGDNNVVTGLVATLADTGTGNNTTGVGTY